MATSVIQSSTAPLFLGDDLALDFINSAYGPSGAHVDHLEDSERASAWFAAAGLATPSAGGALGSLSAEARQLRDHARDLVERRKRGEPADPGLLNRVLEAGSAYATLDWPAGDVPSIVMHERAESTSGLLLPWRTRSLRCSPRRTSILFESVRATNAHCGFTTAHARIIVAGAARRHVATG